MGVYQRKNGRWSGRYVDNGQQVNVGTYDTKQQAVLAVARARSKQQLEYKASENDFNFTIGKEPTKKPTLRQRVLSWLFPNRNLN